MFCCLVGACGSGARNRSGDHGGTSGDDLAGAGGSTTDGGSGGSAIASRGGGRGGDAAASDCTPGLPCSSLDEICPCEEASSAECDTFMQCVDCCLDASCPPVLLGTACPSADSKQLLWREFIPDSTTCEPSECPGTWEAAENHRCEPRRHTCQYTNEQIECGCDRDWSTAPGDAGLCGGYRFGPLFWNCAPVIGSTCPTPGESWGLACVGYANPYYRYCADDGTWTLPDVGSCER